MFDDEYGDDEVKSEDEMEIVGLMADKNAIENWEDDFIFDDYGESESEEDPGTVDIPQMIKNLDSRKGHIGHHFQRASLKPKKLIMSNRHLIQKLPTDRRERGNKQRFGEIIRGDTCDFPGDVIPEDNIIVPRERPRHNSVVRRDSGTIASEPDSDSQESEDWSVDDSNLEEEGVVRNKTTIVKERSSLGVVPKNSLSASISPLPTEAEIDSNANKNVQKVDGEVEEEEGIVPSGLEDEDESETEDWDADIAAQEGATPAKQFAGIDITNLLTKTDNNDRVDTSWLFTNLTKSRGGPQVKIVRIPPASQVSEYWSLKKPAIGDIQFTGWLKQYVESGKYNVKPRALDCWEDGEEKKQDYGEMPAERKSSFWPKSLSLSSTNLKGTLLNKPSLDAIEYITRFTERMCELYGEKNSVAKIRDHLEKLIDDIKSDYLQLKGEDYELFKRFLLPLHTASKDFSLAWEDKFTILSLLIKTKFPKFEAHTEHLIYCKEAHFGRKPANDLMRKFVNLYLKYKWDETQAGVDIATKALVSFNLYVENYSPLNCSILSEAASYDFESNTFEWLDLDIPKRGNQEVEYREDEQRKLQYKLTKDVQFRVASLLECYEKINERTFLKAKCAWCIAHNKLYHFRELRIAEQLYFECLYTLHSLDDCWPKGVPMFTELCTNAFIDYADVLLENGKYKYSTLALINATQILYYRNRVKERAELERKLCVVGVENADWKLLIQYYKRALMYISKKTNLQEFIFISIQLAKLSQTQEGNFFDAERYLQEALHEIYGYLRDDFLNLELESGGKIVRRWVHDTDYNSAFYDILMSLTRLYIEGNRLEAAIGLSQFLSSIVSKSSGYVSNTKLVEIQLLLIKAYMKDNKHVEASKLMDKIPVDKLRRKGSSIPKLPRDDRLLQLNTPIDNAHNAQSMIYSFDFAEHRILNWLQTEKFDEALKLCKLMIRRIDQMAFAQKARFYYLKGKIHQARTFKQLRTGRLLKMTSAATVVSVDKFCENKIPGEPPKVHKQTSSKPFLDVIDGNTELKRPKSTESFHSPFSKPVSSEKFSFHMARQSSSEYLVPGQGTPLSTTSNCSISFKNGGNRPKHIRKRTYSDRFHRLPNIKNCTTAFTQANIYSSYVEDSLRQSKCFTELSQTCLEIMMYAEGLQKHAKFLPGETSYCIPNQQELREWVLETGLVRESNNDVVKAFLDAIDDISVQALNSSTTCLNINLILHGYLNIAELRLLQNRMRASRVYWEESKKAFWSIYRESNDWIIIRHMDPQFRLEVYAILKRIVRLLICFKERIIEQNLDVIESFQALETFMFSQEDFQDSLAVITKPIETKNKTSPEELDEGKKSELLPSEQSTERPLLQNQDSDQRTSWHSVAESWITNKAGFINWNILDRNPPTPTHRETKLEEKTLEELIGEGEEWNAEQPQESSLKSRFRSTNKADLIENVLLVFWKMRRDAERFSDMRGNMDIKEVVRRNRTSLRSIVKIVKELNYICQSKVKTSKVTSLRKNMAYVISLNSLVCVFHPDSLTKHSAVNVDWIRKKSMRPSWDCLRAIAMKLDKLSEHGRNLVPHTEYKIPNNPNSDLKRNNGNVVTVRLSLEQKVDSNNKFSLSEDEKLSDDEKLLNSCDMKVELGVLEDGIRGERLDLFIEAPRRKAVSQSSYVIKRASSSERDVMHQETDTRVLPRTTFADVKRHTFLYNPKRKKGASSDYGHHRSVSANLYNTTNSSQISAECAKKQARDTYHLFSGKLQPDQQLGTNYKFNSLEKAELMKEFELPILHWKEVYELFTCLDPQNISLVFTALLNECKIIFISEERLRVLAVIHSLLSLLHPFSWQHLCIPWLMPSSASILRMNAPFIIGVADVSSVFKFPPDAVRVRVDSNFVSSVNIVPLPKELRIRIRSGIHRAHAQLLRLHFQAVAAFNDESKFDSPNYVPPSPATPPLSSDSASSDSTRQSPRPINLSDKTSGQSQRRGYMSLRTQYSFRRRNTQRTNFDVLIKNLAFNNYSYPSLHPKDFSFLPKRHHRVTSYYKKMFNENLPEHSENIQNIKLSTSSLRKPSNKPNSSCSERWRMFNEDIDIDKEAAKKILVDLQQNDFLPTWARLVWVYRICWDQCSAGPLLDNVKNEMCRSPYTLPQFKSFLSKFMDTKIFKVFLNLRFNTPELDLNGTSFEQIVLKTISLQWQIYRELLLSDPPLMNSLIYQRCGGADVRSKRLWCVVSERAIKMFKNKKSVSILNSIDIRMDSHNLKWKVEERHPYTIAGSSQVHDYAEARTFFLYPSINEKNSNQEYHKFICKDEKIRQQWITAIQARIMRNIDKLRFRNLHGAYNNQRQQDWDDSPVV